MLKKKKLYKNTSLTSAISMESLDKSTCWQKKLIRIWRWRGIVLLYSWISHRPAIKFRTKVCIKIFKIFHIDTFISLSVTYPIDICFDDKNKPNPVFHKVLLGFTSYLLYTSDLPTTRLTTNHPPSPTDQWICQP